MRKSQSTSNLESDLHISPRPVIAILVAVGLAIALVGDAQPDPADRLDMVLLALLIYAASAIAWMLAGWKPWAGRWFTVLMLVTIIHLGHGWLSVPGFLNLVATPVILAAAMIDLRAAGVTAVGQTVLLVWQPGPFASDAGRVSTVVAVAGVWAALGAMVAVSSPTHQLNQWLWEYFQRVQGLLEEARDRKAELEQALDDLAHANRQLALANERLAALRLIAEEAQRTKAAFVAKVSHELRTPLNMIIGLIDLLVETPEVYGEDLPPALFEDLEIVRRNCEHLSSMVNDVLDLSQAEAGQHILRREHVDLAEVIDAAAAVVRPLLKKKGLALRVIISDVLPEINCDRTRIRQVILNLLSNAARFTEQGGITLRVELEPQHVVISVTDTGPGIPPGDAEKIFEPFYQGTGGRRQDGRGSGLGLSISRQFVELHGGQIWFESKAGAGTTFVIKLPLSAPVAHVARSGRWIMEDWVWAERAPRSELPALPSGPRVVVCDETGDLCPAFSRCSDEVEFVDTGDLSQAAEEVRRCPAHAVVLNVQSPEDLWARVGEAGIQMPGTPVIGCCVPPQLEYAQQAGATNYLTKPVTRADLEKVIHSIGVPVRRVLVVDDDADVVQLLTRMLAALDGTLEVVTASRGAQALDELRAGPPDLMLLDVMMPDMDGWRVLELKGQDEAIRDVPVVLVTAQDPARQPMASSVLMASLDQGLSISKLLRCSLALSTLFLQSGQGPGPAPV
jgi:signal transduction histidine kinase/CheY-like chemotaxis protein